jgi:hypothetical protein
MGRIQEARLLQHQSVPRRMGLAHDFHVPRLTTDITATGPAFSIPDAGMGSVTMRGLEDNQRGPGMYHPKHPSDVHQPGSKRDGEGHCVFENGVASRTCVSATMTTWFLRVVAWICTA